MRKICEAFRELLQDPIYWAAHTCLYGVVAVFTDDMLVRSFLVLLAVLSAVNATSVWWQRICFDLRKLLDDSISFDNHVSCCNEHARQVLEDYNERVKEALRQKRDGGAVVLGTAKDGGG
jgi:hypothetical protein